MHTFIYIDRWIDRYIILNILQVKKYIKDLKADAKKNERKEMFRINFSLVITIFLTRLSRERENFYHNISFVSLRRSKYSN